MFNFWKKKDIQGVQELEEELIKIKNKSKAELLSFIGVSEKIKGLNLIYESNNSVDFKLLAGIFAELYEKIDIIKENFLFKSVETVTIQSSERILIYSPITESVIFLGLLPNKKHIKTLTDWITKNKLRFNLVFQK